MAVTYNKINWDEETPITVSNLDRIDVGIDEVATQANSNEGRIITNEGDISSNEGRITTNENDISNLITIVNGGRWDVFSKGTPPSDIEVTFFITDSNFHLKYIDNENNNTYTHDTGISVGPISANGRRFILFNASWDLETKFAYVRFTVFEITLP